MKKVKFSAAVNVSSHSYNGFYCLIYCKIADDVRKQKVEIWLCKMWCKICDWSDKPPSGSVVLVMVNSCQNTLPFFNLGPMFSCAAKGT